VNEIKAAENRRIRGQILNVLHMNCPNMLSERQVTSWIEQLGYVTYGEIKGFLEYLKDAGYIAIEQKETKLLHQENCFVKITPKGTNLFEGNIPEDPGIDLR